MRKFLTLMTLVAIVMALGFKHARASVQSQEAGDLLPAENLFDQIVRETADPQSLIVMEIEVLSLNNQEGRGRGIYYRFDVHSILSLPWKFDGLYDLPTVAKDVRGVGVSALRAGKSYLVHVAYPHQLDIVPRIVRALEISAMSIEERRLTMENARNSVHLLSRKGSKWTPPQPPPRGCFAEFILLSNPHGLQDIDQHGFSVAEVESYSASNMEICVIECMEYVKSSSQGAPNTSLVRAEVVMVLRGQMGEKSSIVVDASNHTATTRSSLAVDTKRPLLWSILCPPYRYVVCLAASPMGNEVIKPTDHGEVFELKAAIRMLKRDDRVLREVHDALLQTSK